MQWLFGNIFQARAIGNHVWYGKDGQDLWPYLQGETALCPCGQIMHAQQLTAAGMQTWGITGAEVIVTSPKLVR